MRTRRLNIPALSLGLLTAFLVHDPSPARAASSLTVDDAPHGDTVVTVSADVLSAPYVRVLLAPTDVAATPAADMTAVATDPVPNTGVPAPVTVPTWGLGGGRTSWFTLVGCTTADPATCTDVLASEQRAVTQDAADAPTGSITRPSGPLLLPQERVTAQASNPGGGRMVAAVSVLRSHDLGDQPADIGDLLQARPTSNGVLGTNVLAVRRCSSVQPSLAFCETPVAGDSVPFVRSAVPTVDALHAFTMNASWWTARQPVTTHAYAHGLPYDLSWELRDPATHRSLTGPVRVLAGSTMVTNTFVVAPVHHVSSLSDGHYDLVFTTTVHKGDLTQVSERSPIDVTVVNDPAADPAPAVRSAHRNMRYPATAHLVTDGHRDPDHSGHLVVVDAHGHEVGHQVLTTALLSCTVSATCPTGAQYDVDVWPYGDDNAALDPGTYALRLDAPDSWGRPTSTPVGALHVQTTRIVNRTVTVRPADVRVPGTRLVGRCSTLRNPALSGADGSLGLMSLSRCRSTSGTDDVVRQDFRLALPSPANAQNMTVQVYRYGVTKASRSDALSGSCRFPGTTSWKSGAVTRNAVGSWLCSRTTSAIHGGTLQMRLRSSAGGRLDVGRLRAYVMYEQWYTPAS